MKTEITLERSRTPKDNITPNSYFLIMTPIRANHDSVRLKRGMCRLTLHNMCTTHSTNKKKISWILLVKDSLLKTWACPMSLSIGGLSTLKLTQNYCLSIVVLRRSKANCIDYFSISPLTFLCPNGYPWITLPIHKLEAFSVAFSRWFLF